MTGVSIAIRPATTADRPFLELRLLDAVNWNPSRSEMSLDAALSEADIAHYIVGWPGPRDAGLVASVDGVDVGAAWWTYFPLEDPGFGFVAPDVPEVTIGVADGWRGRGAGRRLLLGLHDLASSRGIERLSLSVEHANHARHLYRSVGYEEVRDDGGALTMVAALRSAIDDDDG